MSRVAVAIVFLRVIRETSRFMLSTPRAPATLMEGASSRADDHGATIRVVAVPSAWRRSLATPKRG